MRGRIRAIGSERPAGNSGSSGNGGGEEGVPVSAQGGRPAVAAFSALHFGHWRSWSGPWRAAAAAAVLGAAAAGGG